MPNFKSVVHFFVVISNYFFSSIFFENSLINLFWLDFFLKSSLINYFSISFFHKNYQSIIRFFQKFTYQFFFSSKNLDILISVYAKQYICVFLLTHPPILGSKTHFRANIDLGGTLWGLFWQSPLKSASQGTF